MSNNPPSSSSSSTSSSSSSTSSSSSSQYTYSTGTYFPTPFHLQQQQQQPYIGAAPPPSVQQQPYIGATPPPPVQQQPYIGATPPPPVQQLSAPYVYPAPAPIPGVYSLPQFQQAQQLFQRDAQTITLEALETVKAALASSEIEHKAEAKKKAIPRKAAGLSWEDPTLAEWPENDYRLFCGDLGNEVNDDVLSKAFSKFPTFNMAKVVRDKRTGKTKGFGFVSFSNPLDLAAALKGMNGKYVGNRPIKLSKSKWQERTDTEALESRKNQSFKKPKTAKKGIFHK